MKREGSRSLLGLMVAQFFGAFNDNAWKMIVVLLAMRAVGSKTTPDSAEREAAFVFQTSLAFLVITIPLCLFSIPAGVIADRVSKRTVIIAMKSLELLLMAGATTALAVAPNAIGVHLTLLGLLGLQSALFSPAKYGILPEILPREALARGNGLLELWTFLAIIAGTAIASELLAFTGFDIDVLDSGTALWTAPLTLMVFSVIGLLASFGVPRVQPARTEGSMGAAIGDAWRAIRADRVLWLVVLGSAFYWGIASLMGAVILAFGRAPLGLENPGLLLAVFGLGVGFGSALAGRMSRGRVEYGLIPLGAVVLAVFTVLLAVLPATRTGTFLLMVPLGVASGWIVVPLNAVLQWRAPQSSRGAVIALANVLVFLGMIVGNFLGLLLSEGAGLPAAGTLLGAAVVTIGGTIWALKLLPEALLRLVLVILTNTFYRLRVVGASHVPAQGGALLVPNHVSFVDGLFLLTSVDRPVRFIVDSAYFKHPIWGPFLRALGAIEISSAGGPRVILKALRDAGEFLDQGEVVCIFAEGQITRTGTMQPFRRGLERIMKGREAPVVPVHLDRLWGSIFSRQGGRFVTKLPRRLPYPVTISFGEPLPSSTPIHAIRRAVKELDSEAWALREASRPQLHRTFIRKTRLHPWRMAFADPLTPRVSYLRALTSAIATGRALRARWEGQENVGVLLPPSVAAAIANVAASLAGRASVNLNYTVGKEGMESAARQAGLRTVITSRAFLEKAGLELPDGLEPIWVEELRDSVGASSRTLALLASLFAPSSLIERMVGGRRKRSNHDTVTIIFSSGSTGEPKGVLLSHFNVDSNVEGVAQVFRLRRHDRILGILPLFHSFGYMALWCSVNQGVGTVFLPNPLDAEAVGEKVLQYRVSILISTPTFLQLYLRRCAPGQFGSLRMVLAGAEKLPERLATAFEDQFGIRPLEGYGTTECAPVVAVNTADYRAPGFFQPGSRRGTVGQPLPGVAVRVIDPDDLDAVDRPLGPGAPGMLIAKGPNVMKGYLGRDDLTSDVIRNGWYFTGDIAEIDEDGYVRITDRLSRFSKIGGEMVPHGTVEEALQRAAGSELQVFAVTAVPDDRKGERLAVLHTIDPSRVPEILEKARESGLPNLFVPRPDDFIRVDSLPVLGTGKLDLREIKRIARDSLAA